MEKETLEDAAERNHNEQRLNTYTPYSFYDAFKDGAKWQAERMYSEEEVLDILFKHTEYFAGFGVRLSLTDWFELQKK